MDLKTKMRIAKARRRAQERGDTRELDRLLKLQKEAMVKTLETSEHKNAQGIVDLLTTLPDVKKKKKRRKKKKKAPTKA